MMIKIEAVVEAVHVMKVQQELLELVKELCIDFFTIQCLKHIPRSVGCQTGMSFPPHKYLSYRQNLLVPEVHTAMAGNDYLQSVPLN